MHSLNSYSETLKVGWAILRGLFAKCNKKVTLTVKQKLEILNLLKEDSLTQQQISNKCGIARSSVANITTKEDSIRSQALHWSVVMST